MDTFHIYSARPTILHRGVGNPDLGLKRTFGNEFEPRQEHVVDVHEPLSDFPLFVSTRVQDLRALRFGFGC